MLEYEISCICQEKCSTKCVTAFLSLITSTFLTTVTNKQNVKELIKVELPHCIEVEPTYCFLHRLQEAK